jgi:hypothetical protein
MNPLQKAILLYLGAKNRSVTFTELCIAINLLSKIEYFKDLKDYLNKLKEPMLP